MECPNCNQIDTKVIDSRLTKDEISIRRRRQCLNCSTRFTTYEASEENLLQVLLRKNTGHGASPANIAKMTDFMTRTLGAVTAESEKFNSKLEKLEKANARLRAGRKAMRRGRRKSSIGEDGIDMENRTRRNGQPTATATVLKIIRRHKQGVDIAKLRDKTGYDDKKIRNIVHIACKKGKIKRASRGVYTMA